MIIREEMIIDEEALIKLLVRYNDGSPELTNDEKEILLFALYNESIANDGIASKAYEVWRKGGQ